MQHIYCKPGSETRERPLFYNQFACRGGGGVVLWSHHYILCNGSKHTELLLVTANKQQRKFTNADLNPDGDLIFFQ